MKVASETSGRVSAAVAQAVKEVRQAAGISQADLAAELGVSQPTISGWERGESAPGFDDIANIEKVCRHPKGAVMRLAGYAPDVSIPELLLTDPDLTADQRKIAADTYRVWVEMARSQRGK